MKKKWLKIGLIVIAAYLVLHFVWNTNVALQASQAPAG